MTCLVISDGEQFQQWITTTVQRPLLFNVELTMLPNDVTLILW